MHIHELEKITQNFQTELERAVKGNKSSLSCITSEVSKRLSVGDNEVFQVIVIGGSIFRSALCQFTDNGLKIKQKRVLKYTPFHSIDEFLTVFSDTVLPEVRILALNFAYPLDPVLENGVLDGLLLSGSKEHELAGVVGKRVGMLISQMLQKDRGQDVTVTVANDTVCLLLSGLTQYKPEELFGGIVGTGVNFAFFHDENSVINLEAGSFDKFSASSEACVIDRNSMRPGTDIFEKDTSGAYLYKHFNLKMQSLNLSFQKLESTMELEKISHSPTMAGEIARDLFDHSAQLVACQIAGILEYKQHNMVGVMEGSLFWKAEHYRILVDTYVRMLSSYSAKFVKIDEDSIIGGAMLVTRGK